MSDAKRACKRDDSSDNSINNATLLDFNWKFFNLQSSQRLQMLHFSIILETALFGYLFSLLAEDNSKVWQIYTAIAAIVFTSTVFWFIDKRTRKLMHTCIDVILFIENEYKDNHAEQKLLFNELKKGKKLSKADKTQKSEDTQRSVFRFRYGFLISFYYCMIIFTSLLLAFLKFSNLLP